MFWDTDVKGKKKKPSVSGFFRCGFYSLNELTEVDVNGKPPAFLSRENVPGDLNVSKVSALM